MKTGKVVEFVDEEIEALDAFGSDHRPLRADLVVPAAPVGSSG